MGVTIANSGKPIHFTAVDHWRGSEGELPHREDPDVQADRLYEVFTSNIMPVAEYVQVLRDDSVRAAAAFKDDSIDFLYVDASHSYERVLADLAAWYPKVRIGGLIAGDDWCFRHRGEFGVRNACSGFLPAGTERSGNRARKRSERELAAVVDCQASGHAVRFARRVKALGVAQEACSCVAGDAAQIRLYHHAVTFLRRIVRAVRQPS